MVYRKNWVFQFPLLTSECLFVLVVISKHIQYFSSVMTCNVLLCFYSARWVKMDGIEYKRNAGVVCGMNHDLPTVGKITSLLVINSDKLYFRVQLFSSLYIEHFRAYTLQPLDSEALISTDDLLSPHPIHIRTTSALPHHPCIILSHHINHVNCL